MASIGYRILQDIQTIVQGLGLTGIDPGSIQIRELPRADDTVDLTPLIAICPAGVYASDPYGFEGQYNVPYGVEVCIIEATLGEYGVVTAQQKRQEWQETVVSGVLTDAGDFRTSLPTATTVWDIRQNKSAVFDRSKLSKLYSYSSVLFEVFSLE